MSLSVNLTVPPTLRSQSNYTVQFSILRPADGSEIFVDNHLTPSTLSNGTDDSQKTATVSRSSLPRFSDGGDIELRAHFWKGDKLVESQKCGPLSL